MASVYANYTVRSADPAAMTKSLKRRSAYGSLVKDGSTVVVDETAG